jgi:hypothetical protein
MRHSAAVALLLAGAALCSAVPTSAAAAASRRANPCPAAPRGWVAAASNPTVFGPAQQPGQEHVMVSCDYTQAPRNAVSVVAEYALPTDLNPLSDFYYGCNARRKQTWTSDGRTFFAASGTRWSYVEFSDPGRQLPDAAEGAFETVARALLKHVSRNAHACKINTVTPTVVHHLYLFGFEFLLSSHELKAFGGIPAQSKSNPLIPDASFSAVSDANATVLARVTSVKAPMFTVQILDGGKRHALRLRINRGIDFLQRPPLQRLRLRLQVVGSNYSRCAKGATGTLTIKRSMLVNAPNAPATIRVRLCGSVFAQGTYRGTAEIISG